MSDLVLNGIIAGVVGIITLLLTRLFSRKDTAFENLVREGRNQRMRGAWQDAVIQILDQELYELRHMWEQIPGAPKLPPRKDWPPRPEMVPEPPVRP